MFDRLGFGFGALEGEVQDGLNLIIDVIGFHYPSFVKSGTVEFVTFRLMIASCFLINQLTRQIKLLR